jgi:hypothetical protein
MIQSLRLSEQWFKRALWAVAFFFAIFLSSLSGVVIDLLPQVEQELSVEEFMDTEKVEEVRKQIDESSNKLKLLQTNLETAKVASAEAETKYYSASEAFKSWLENRKVTQDAKKDDEVTQRQINLDALNEALATQRAEVLSIEKQIIETQQINTTSNETLQGMTEDAAEQLQDEQQMQELRIFGYRLAMTLPMLFIAGLLVAKKRNSQYWPFVWGFVAFAIMTFFIELVPYLPSYGGLVQYTIGGNLTALIGKYLIDALRKYKERQSTVEAQDDHVRRQAMQYDSAQAYLAKSLCPGCERPADLKSSNYNHCSHCGLNLFGTCSNCGSRKSSFTKFCHQCGHPDSN